MKTKAKPPYDGEELEILQAWEAGALKPVNGMAQHIKTHRDAAEATFDSALRTVCASNAVGE